MPTDVFAEASDYLARRTQRCSPTSQCVQICSFVTPETLLALSRVCKRWRNFLLRRTSSNIWASGRANVGLGTPLAKDLSEPDLALLVYGRNCDVSLCRCHESGKRTDGTALQLCDRIRIQRVEYPIRARLCESCYTNKYVRLRCQSLYLPCSPLTSRGGISALSKNAFDDVLSVTLSCVPFACTLHLLTPRPRD